MDRSRLRKAIDALALGYTEGNVSIDILEKACSNYKSAIGFVQDFDYDLIVAKSCIDALNGIPGDNELNKAIIPGQTKVVDGVTYVYSATKQGSKTQYDWHIVNTNQSGKVVGRGAKLTAAQKQDKQKYINDLFPKDINSLKVVGGGSLGGSTGAQLVEDADGNRYVMKRGTNTSNDHVKSEYLANQLYDMLGVRVPDYELYNDNGTNILLSRFVSGLTPVNKQSGQKDRKDLAQHAMADVLMANWDAFCNDNSNRDAAGRIIRVDNGGSLNFKARGDHKTFDGDVVKTYNDMVRYNQAVFGELSDADIIAQIKELQQRKDGIVNYLKLAGEDKLADIFAKRIDNLSQIAAQIDFRANANKRKILPRQLKSKKEMYRDFTEDEVQEFFDNATGSNGEDKVTHVGSSGWDLVHTICEARGFTARPRVVDDATYWSEIAKGKTQLFRGLHDAHNDPNCTVAYQKDHFKYNDDFYLGQQGIYGGGLYVTVNDGDKHGGKTDKSRGAYRTSTAFGYASSGYGSAGDPDGSVMLMALEDDVNLIDHDKLKDMLRKDPKTTTSIDPKDRKKADALEKEIKQSHSELNALNDDLLHIGDKIKDGVYKKYHYDEKSVANIIDEIDDITDWGAVDADGDPDFPKYKEFVEGKIVKAVKDNGGTVTYEHGQVTLQMPNSRQKFTIMQYQWDMPSIIRRNNPLSPHYHNYAKKFEIWFNTNHVDIVQKKLQEEMQTIGDKVTKIKDDIQKKSDELSKKTDERQKLLSAKKEPDKNMWHAISESVVGRYGSDEALGVYAALLGYDGIYVPNGNHSHCGFVVMLNRSKIIVRQ